MQKNEQNVNQGGTSSSLNTVAQSRGKSSWYVSISHGVGSRPVSSEDDWLIRSSKLMRAPFLTGEVLEAPKTQITEKHMDITIIC